MNFPLLRSMIWRDISARYRGSVLGILWPFITPLVMLAVYTFVFSYVFNARWGSGGGTAEFSVILFAGLIVHALFAENLMRSPTAITASPNFVKKVVFPLEILPLVILGSSLFHFLVSFLVLVLGLIAVFGKIPAAILYLPLIIFPLLLLSAGMNWFLASLGAYLRDITQVTGTLANLALMISPILYPVEKLPSWLQAAIYLNPVSFIVESLREAAIWGRAPSFTGLALYSGAALLIALAGFAFFRKARKGFADVV